MEVQAAPPAPAAAPVAVVPVDRVRTCQCADYPACGWAPRSHPAPFADLQKYAFDCLQAEQQRQLQQQQWQQQQVDRQHRAYGVQSAVVAAAQAVQDAQIGMLSPRPPRAGVVQPLPMMAADTVPPTFNAMGAWSHPPQSLAAGDVPLDVDRELGSLSSPAPLSMLPGVTHSPALHGMYPPSPAGRASRPASVLPVEQVSPAPPPSRPASQVPLEAIALPPAVAPKAQPVVPPRRSAFATVDVTL